MKKKILLAASFFLLALVVLFFRVPLFLSIAKWQLTSYTEKHFSEGLTYESIVIERGNLILKKPRLKSKIFPSSEDTVEVLAEEATLSYSLKLLDWKANTNIALNQAKVIFSKNHHSSFSIEKFFKNPSLIFSLPVGISIQKGLLELQDFTNETHLQTHQFLFSFNHSPKSNKSLSLQLHKISSDKENNQIDLVLQSKNHAFISDLSIKDTSVDDIIDTLNVFIPNPIKGWTASEGVVSGNITATLLKEDTIPYLIGDLSLKNCSLNNKESTLLGYLETANLHFSKKQSFNEPILKTCLPSPIEKLLSKTISSFEISQGSFLSHSSKNGNDWKIKDLTTVIQSSEDCSLKILTRGLLHQNDHFSSILLEGHSELNREGIRPLTANVNIFSNASADTSILLKSLPIDSSQQNVSVEIKNLGKGEYSLIKDLFLSGELSTIQVKDGSLNASLEASLIGFHPQKLSLHHLSGQDLTLYLAPSQVNCIFPKLQGQGDINLQAPFPLASLKGEFSISDSSILFKEKTLHKWNLKHLNASLHFSKGMLQDSTAEAKLGNLTASAKFNWFATKDDLVNCSLTGTSKDLSPFLPEDTKDAFLQNFSSDRINISVGLQRILGGLQIQGSADFISLAEKIQSIKFHSNLEKTDSAIWKNWPISNTKTQQWLKLSRKCLKVCSPAIISPTIAATEDWLSQEVGVKGVVIRNGQFGSRNLPLSKFVAPFVFPQKTMNLRGFADIAGSFNHRKILVNYLVKQLSLENSHLKVHTPIHAHLDNPDSYKAFHYLDLNSKDHFGFIQSQGSSYTDKHSRSIFSNIFADVYISQDHIHIENIQTSSQNIQFQGNINIDHSNSDAIDVTIHTKSIQGSVSDAQKFLSRFDNFSFSNLPLKGSLSSNRGLFHFCISPKELLFDTTFRGKIYDASYGTNEDHTSLNNLCVDFEYNHGDRKLKIPKISGTWLASKQIAPLNFSSRHIYITDTLHPKIAFDIYLEGMNYRKGRLVGKAQTKEENPHLISLSFDNNQSFLGNISPNISNCILKDWKEVLLFKAEPELHLSSIFEDFELLLSTGLLPSKAKQICEYKNYKLFGEMLCKIHYDNKEGEYKFNALGEELIFNNTHVNNVFFNSVWKDEHFYIKQLNIDQLSLVAELEEKTDHLAIDSLRLRYGKSLVLDFEGKYFLQKQKIQGTLNHLESDLEYLHEYPLLQNHSNLWKAQGILHATGNFEADFSPIEAAWSLKSTLHSSLKNLSLLGISFQDQDNINLKYSTKHGLDIKNMLLNLPGDISECQEPTLKIAQLHYANNKNSWYCKNFSFALTPESLKTLSGIAQKLFPTQNRDIQKLESLLQSLKRSSTLKGFLNLDYSSPETSLSLFLEDEKYFINNAEHQLKNFKLQYSPKALQILTQYLLEEKSFWIACKADSTQLKTGVAILSEAAPNELQDPSKMLAIHWEKNQQDAFSITKAEGEFSGLRFQLKPAQSTLPLQKKVLLGKIDIDWKKASLLFPLKLQKHMQKIKIGKGYTLAGIFFFPLTKIQNASFNGILQAQDFEFMNHHFKKLSAQADLGCDFINIRNLNLQDPALKISCKKLSMYKSPNAQWCFNTPLIKIEDLHPSLLQKENEAQAKTKTLLVKYADIREISGVLFSPETYQGKGQLHFNNLSKKNLFHILFAIPNDLISRIGLDLNLLTPVTGTIDYEIKGDKIHFTKFNDVYSEGKRSKFFLSKNSGDSYMDFSGNLDITIKMKQYNLIFKLAELFSISIRGTLQKPFYTLQKQSPDHIPNNLAEEKAKEDQQRKLSETKNSDDLKPEMSNHAKDSPGSA